MMKFVNNEHEQFYRTHATASDENCKKALIYALGIDEMCRDHFGRLYNTSRNCIRPEGLREDWQTGASRRVTRLAFNLYTWSIVDGDDPAAYAPHEIFFGLDDLHRNGVLLALTYFA